MRYTTRPLTAWDGPRTPAAQRFSRYRFRASWGNTLEMLERELWHLSASDVVLDADFREQDLRLDGAPRSNARQPVDPGVRLSFESVHGHLVYQADGYEFWQHNVRAIALGLEALRAVDRYGITSRAQQYDGWKQIEAPATTTIATWEDAVRTIARLAGIAHDERAVLAEFNADPEIIRGLYRRAARRTHPDAGGTAEEFDLLTRARTELDERGFWPASHDDDL